MTYLLRCLTHCRSLNSLRQCDRQLQESDQLLNLFQTYYRQLLSCSLSQVEIWHLLLLWWLLYLRFLLHNSLKRRTRKPRHSRQQWEIHKTSVLSYKKVKILNREHMNKWGTSTYRYFVLGSSAEINTEKKQGKSFLHQQRSAFSFEQIQSIKTNQLFDVTGHCWNSKLDVYAGFFCSFCVKGEWTCYQVKPAKTWFDLMAASSCFSTRIPCKSHSCGELFHLYIFLHIMCKCSGTRN